MSPSEPRQWPVAAHRDLAFDLVRAYLGVALMAKGIFFLANRPFLFELLRDRETWLAPFFLVHYIAIAHISGGAFLAVGLYTRLAALVQIPILVGAVFLIHLREGLFTHGQSLELSVLVLFLLVLAAVFGGGRLSMDGRMKRAASDVGDGVH